jgi:hypothetical protein
MPRNFDTPPHAQRGRVRYPYRRVDTEALQVAAQATIIAPAVAPHPPSGTAAIRAMQGVLTTSRVADLLTLHSKEDARHLDLPWVELPNGEAFVTPDDFTDFLDDLAASARSRHRATRDGRCDDDGHPDGPARHVPRAR